MAIEKVYEFNTNEIYSNQHHFHFPAMLNNPPLSQTIVFDNTTSYVEMLLESLCFQFSKTILEIAFSLMYTSVEF